MDLIHCPHCDALTPEDWPTCHTCGELTDRRQMSKQRQPHITITATCPYDKTTLSRGTGNVVWVCPQCKREWKDGFAQH